MAETTEQYKARIAQIKSSIVNEPYIKKMRDDIAEGISKTGNRQADIEDQFKDVIEGTTGKDVISAPEIIAARKGEASLNARLTKNEQETTAQFQQTNAQLSQKVNLTYLDAILLDIAKGGPKGYFTSIAALKAMYPDATGAEGVWLVFDSSFGSGAHSFIWDSVEKKWKDLGQYQSDGIINKGVTTKKIENKSVTYDKTSFLKVASNNLFDKETVTYNRSIDTETGEPKTVSGFVLSDFIPVIPSTNYTIRRFLRYAYYDSNYNFINTTAVSPTNTPTTITNPSNSYYVRCVCLLADLGDARLNKGNEMKVYDSYKMVLDNVILPDDIVTAKSLTEDASIKISSDLTNKLVESGYVSYSKTAMAEANNNENKTLLDRIKVINEEFFHIYFEQLDPLSLYNIVVKTSLLDNTLADDSIRVNILKKSDNSVISTTKYKYIGKGVFSITGIKVKADEKLQFVVWNKSGSDFFVEKTLVAKTYIPTDLGLEKNSNGENIRYVAKSGSDENNGESRKESFATFQKAIDAGADVIYAESGDYFGQKINVDNRESLVLKVLDSEYKQSDLEKPKARIINAIDLDLEIDSFQNIYKTALDLDKNSNFYKVFVSKTLPISPKTPHGPSYHAVLWETNDSDFSRDKKLKPVLTLEKCKEEEGTFFYNGQHVYVNPTGGFITGKKYKRLINDTGKIAEFKNIRNKLVVSDFSFLFAADENIMVTNCDYVLQRNVETGYSAYITGSRTKNANGDFYNCISYKNEYDGFSPAFEGYGNVNYHNCEGYYNYDDGLSHHSNTTGTVWGGEWHHNGKGGIAPAHGAKVDIHNIISHHNKYGMYSRSDEGTNAGRTVRHIGNVYYDNEVGIDVLNYHVLSFNCKYENNTVPVQKTDNENTSFIEL